MNNNQTTIAYSAFFGVLAAFFGDFAAFDGDLGSVVADFLGNRTAWMFGRTPP